MAVAAPTELGLRERKKLKTRRALRDAAIRLATERGYEAVTAEEIAEAAEVSTRTFFNYFASKDDAIAGIGPDEIAEITDALEARPREEPPLDAIRAVMLGRVPDMYDRREQMRDKMRLVRANPALLEHFHAGWSRYEQAVVAVVAGRLAVDPDTDAFPAVVVAAALAATRVVTLRWRDAPEDNSLAELLSTAFDDLARGLTPRGATTGGTTGASNGEPRSDR